MMRTRAVLGAVLFSGLVAFVAVATNAVAGEITETPTSSSSSSGGCLPPSLTADFWTGTFPHSNGSIENRERDCLVLCGSHMRKCRTVVRLAKSCGTRGAGTFGQLLKDICNTYENRQTRSECREQSRLFTDEYRACIREDAELGRECCERNIDACLADCIDEESFEIQRCFTGGSCIFDALNSVPD